MVFLYFGKRNFLIFQEMKLSNLKNKKFQEVRNRARKNKKTTLKKYLIFWENGTFLSPSLKRSYIFSKNNFSYISGNGTFLLQAQKKKFPLHFGNTCWPSRKIKKLPYSRSTAENIALLWPQQNISFLWKKPSRISSPIWIILSFSNMIHNEDWRFELWTFRFYKNQAQIQISRPYSESHFRLLVWSKVWSKMRTGDLKF